MNDLVLSEVDAAADRSAAASLALLRQIDAWDLGGHGDLAQAGLELLAEVTPRLALLNQVRGACVSNAPESLTAGDLAKDALIETHTLSARIEQILARAADHEIAAALA